MCIAFGDDKTIALLNGHRFFPCYTVFRRDLCYLAPMKFALSRDDSVILVSMSVKMTSDTIWNGSNMRTTRCAAFNSCVTNFDNLVGHSRLKSLFPSLCAYAQRIAVLAKL